MRDINTQRPMQYFGELLLWQFLSGLFFQFRFLINWIVPFSGATLGRRASILVFWSIVLLVTAVGYLKTHRYRRNSASLFLLVALPLEVYLLPILLYRLPWLFCIELAVFIGLFVLFRKGALKDCPPGKRKEMRARFRRAIPLLVAIAFAAAPAISLGGSFFGKNLLSPPIASVSAESEEDAISEHSVELTNLLFGEDTLSYQQKVAALQTLAAVESMRLGLREVPSVTPSPLEDVVEASYLPATNTIQVNSIFLEDSTGEEAFSTLCHECRHAYQQQLIELYGSVDEEYRSLAIFDDAKAFLADFSDYQSGTVDFESYYVQACETDARAYAEATVAYYKDFLTPRSGG